MKISVEKYPLGRNKKRFLFSREKLRSRYTRYSSSDAHGGTSSPSLVSLVERKFACTRTKVQNHDFTERDGTIDRGGKREEKREEASNDGPFFRIDVSFLCSLGDTGNPRPRSLLELLNRGNRKGNPISREGGGPALRVDRRGENPLSPFWKIQIHRGTRSN